jgi:DNA-binding transcriptional MerR regulator
MQDSEGIVTIGEICKALGLTTRTLRYWEEVGIIESVARTDGANRGYTPYTVRRIKFIMKLKEFGLTIREMQDLYKVYGEAKQTERMIPELVRILDMHVDMIDEKMAKLLALRTEIADYCHKIQDKFNASVQ